LDTNAIFTGTASDLLRREVDELIRASTVHGDLNVRWYLPEIVRHERQFQMLSRGLQLLPSIEKLERVLGHSLAITTDIVEARVKETVERQIQERELQVQSLDTARVDWPRVALDSAYRRPPFDSGETEKGFRDALVLETFVQIVEASPKTPKLCRVILLTADKLLAQAAETRTSDRANTKVFGSLEELKGFINTLAAEVDEAFVNAVTPTANSYFFTENDKDTLIFKGEAIEQIRTKFAARLADLPSGATSRRNGSWLVQAPRFVRKERQRVFWATRIEVEAKAFASESTGVSVQGLLSTLGEGTSFQASSLSQLPTSSDPAPSSSASGGAPFIPIPATFYGSTNLGLRPLTIPNVRLVAAGKTVFEVNWSVAISTRMRLTKGRIESVAFVETVWES
jgi:hypothetical protein